MFVENKHDVLLCENLIGGIDRLMLPSGCFKICCTVKNYRQMMTSIMTS